MSKQRVDQLLVERGLAQDRAQAQAVIMAGQVYSGERKILKAGEMVAEDAALTLRRADHPWVSRGGLKLAHGLEHFAWDVEAYVTADIGASTGGFTDVLLNKGAAKVYAVDVGQGQLDWRLRNDSRVVVLEKTNARHLTQTEIPEPLDLVTCDASFISLKTVLPAGLALTKPEAKLLALIKPQFEVAKHEVGQGGVVRVAALHRRVCDDLTQWLEQDMRWRVIGITPSPIKGPEGNIEFLIAAQRSPA